MPATSRTQQKAEAKYNVTTEFPRLDLHFAAASGNLGLVEYALSHGQPINSVLNGVLPLHAACAGGSEVVVRHLINEGADVNAPRLPRKYSNEKHKSSGLAVGASGSTPLHFAAANGHLAIVRLLLAHGAVPDRADKHGVTPESLARENGWLQCAAILQAWSGGRAGDLPPLHSQSQNAEASSSGSAHREESIDIGTSASVNDSVGPGVGSRRLHVKHSLDNALHLFKASRALHHHSSHSQLGVPPSPTSSAGHGYFHLPHALPHLHHTHSSPPASPSHVTNAGTIKENMPMDATPLGEYTFYPTPSPTPAGVSPSDHRRPSLPQIFGAGPGSGLGVGSSKGSARRPRSAGEDAEQKPGLADASGGAGPRFALRSASSGAASSGYGYSCGYMAGSGSGFGFSTPDMPGSGSSSSSLGTPGIPSASSSGTNTGTSTPRKLGSKISLRNLFRRAGIDGAGSPGGGGSEPASYSGSPSPIHAHQHHQQRASSKARSTSSGASGLTPPASPLSASFSTPGLPRPQTQFRARMYSEGTAPGPGPALRSPLASHARELADEEEEDGSDVDVEGTEEVSEDAQSVSTTTPLTGTAIGIGIGPAPMSARPSILRGHNRSSSSQSPSPSSSSFNLGSGAGGRSAPPRTLRFDASSSPSSAESSNSALPLPLSAPRMPSYSRVQASGALRGSRSASSLRHTESFSDEDDEDDEFGKRMPPPESAPASTARFEDNELEITEGEDDGRETEDVFPVQRGEAMRFEYASTTTAEGQQRRHRNRGASFASNASSSPGAPVASAESRVGAAQYGEFPFSIEHGSAAGPESAPASSASNVVKTSNSLDTQQLTDGRARGDSVSSMESGVSSLTNTSSPSPATAPRTPNALAPGEAPTLPLALNRKESGSGQVYAVDSPASSLEDVSGPISAPATPANPGVERARAKKPILSSTGKAAAPLDLRGVSNLAEAEALAARARNAVLSSAALPAEGPNAPPVSLGAQLAAYGQILALERRFARGEKQRTQWARDADAESVEEGGRGRGEEVDGIDAGAGDVGVLGDLRTPQSAKEARMIASQKRREAAAVRQATLTLGPAPTRSAPRSPRRATPGAGMGNGVAKPPKVRRPHTAEGAMPSSWSFASPSAATGGTGADALIETDKTAGAGVQTRLMQVHARSTSTPMYVSNVQDTDAIGASVSPGTNIEIVEIGATPVDLSMLRASAEGARTEPLVHSSISSLPTTAPASVTAANINIPSSTSYTATPPGYAQSPMPTPRTRSRPSLPHTLPPRARTPDPEPPISPATDDGEGGGGYRTGVPLTRVFTAPGSAYQDYGGRSGSASLDLDTNSTVRPGTVGLGGRRSGGAHKLARMGFSVEKYGHSPGAGTPVGANAGTGTLSRSPPKRALGGLRNLVQSLKGKA